MRLVVTEVKTATRLIRFDSSTMRLLRVLLLMRRFQLVVTGEAPPFPALLVLVVLICCRRATLRPV